MSYFQDSKKTKGEIIMAIDDAKTVEKRLEDLEKRLGIIEPLVHTSSTDNSSTQKQKVKRISSKEFLLSKKPSSDVAKTLALAYYLERFEKLDSFNISDIEVVFREAREKSPSNFNDVINKNIAKGFIMETRELKDAKKAWVLTATGERFIENEPK